MPNALTSFLLGLGGGAADAFTNNRLANQERQRQATAETAANTRADKLRTEDVLTRALLSLTRNSGTTAQGIQGLNDQFGFKLPVPEAPAADPTKTPFTVDDDLAASLELPDLAGRQVDGSTYLKLIGESENRRKNKASEQIRRTTASKRQASAAPLGFDFANMSDADLQKKADQVSKQLRRVTMSDGLGMFTTLAGAEELAAELTQQTDALAAEFARRRQAKLPQQTSTQQRPAQSKQDVRDALREQGLNLPPAQEELQQLTDDDLLKIVSGGK